MVNDSYAQTVIPESQNPLEYARVVWPMASVKGNERYPVELEPRGPVLFEELESAERGESLKRGGEGYAATLNGGCLLLDTHRARKLRPSGSVLSIYIQAQIEPEDSGALFFSDFIGLVVHPSGLAAVFLGVETPSGRVYRESPLCPVRRGQWLDMVLCVGDGRLAFYCNGVPECTIAVPQALCAPFDDDLVIGGFKCGKPDTYGTTAPFGLFRHCRIGTVALWHDTLSDDHIAFLCGRPYLEKAAPKNELLYSFNVYNAFFDASVNKDVAACQEYWDEMKAFARRDPTRPVYHLTQPLGVIYDPCGAFFYGGKYHVFSYCNINYLLNYSSLNHYVSDDLVHWTGWPIGPFADSEHDVFCIYLMNHFLDDRGQPSVLYTGQGTKGKRGILARSEDGLISYTHKQAVLDNYHHDGHVWKRENLWYTITSKLCRGTRKGDRGDPVMLWSSPDLEHWSEEGEIFTQRKEAHNPEGFMEFPYLLSFDGREVLLLGGHPVKYWIGRFDWEEKVFRPDHPNGKLLDAANPFHCFNPLCVDQKGPGGSPRRIIMALYRDIGGREAGRLPWNCVHAQPRVLSLEDDHLRQDILPEMSVLRGAHHAFENVSVRPDMDGYIKITGDCMEILAEFSPEHSGLFGLKAHMTPDGSRGVRIFYDAASGEFGVDGHIKNSGRGPAYIREGDPIRLHVFLDRQLIEVFVNGQTCTTSLNDVDSHGGIDLFSEGGVVRCASLHIWELQ